MYLFITLSVRKLCPRAWSSQQTSRSLTRLKKESIWHSFDLDSECQSILEAPGNFRGLPLAFITFSSRNSPFFIHCISFTVRYSQGISFHSFPHLLPWETFLARHWCKESGWINRTRRAALAELLSAKGHSSFSCNSPVVCKGKLYQ